MNKTRSKFVEWLLPISTKSIAQLSKSNLASVRLRAVVSMLNSQQNNLTVSSTADMQAQDNGDLLVVGKIDHITDRDRPQRWLTYMELARLNGTKILIDYTDHHLSTIGPRADFYKSALQIADCVVCSSEKLKSALSIWYDRQIAVIEDPIEVNVSAPAHKNSTIKTALWFGHGSNLPYLFDFLANRFQYKCELRLIIMTNLNILPDSVTKLLQREHLKSVKINLVQWSVEDMQLAAAISDFCIIPAGFSDDRKNGASSNRLITALALGLPTAADMLDSYRPFQEFFTDLNSDKLSEFLSKPELQFDSVEAAQRTVLKNYTAFKMATKWSKLFDSIS